MANQATAQIDASAAGSNQVLTFTLGDETYGVDILRVQEIRGWSPVTRIPQAPSHVLGVLNLRGSIVPIVDLRMRFNLQRAEYTPLTVIIVLSVESSIGRRDFGSSGSGVRALINCVMFQPCSVRPMRNTGWFSRMSSSTTAPPRKVKTL